MKPPPFEYVVPDTLEEALEILAERRSEAKPLAGGQSLVPTMNFRLSEPGLLVDLRRIENLAGIRGTEDGGLEIGAMTLQADAERSPLVAERTPLLAEALPWVAHAQIRNRGTVGGSLAHADPAAELPAVALALGARVETCRAGGRSRWIDAETLWPGMFATAIEPEELLTRIRFPPAAPGSGFAFRELARRSGDFALVGVAAVVRLDEDGRCGMARITLLSVADRPLVANEGAKVLIGRIPTPAVIVEAARAVAARDVDPPSDIHASAAYRRHLCQTLTRRALTAAFDRGGDRPGHAGPRWRAGGW
ncbi:MAG: xanthine dehydrogenase family protein subunit M [Gemmatimonadetes bacterium]|nr:xanthine dehydrogenase family protein subunit M [Gemmatimonadota bacterium]